MTEAPSLPERAFRVRRATVADAAQLAQVGATLFAQTFGPQNRPEDLRAYLAAAFGEAQQRRELSDASNLIWMAEDGLARPIGYAHVKVRSSPESIRLAGAAELARIYADHGWHGRGVGAELLRACVEAARASGADVLWLGVWKENPRGVAFYRKHGFDIVGEQTFQLGNDPQHDWIMTRRLTPAAQE